ncbi:MAG: ribonuclease III [Oscillospiraceae bacterium]|nr:MAG: ribonuclease III [Oscillospiraceae bacterium]
MPADTAGLEKTIGYIFKNRKLLHTALTHSSYSNEKRAHGDKESCNERLEFLGDSVLSLIVSDYIFSVYPDMPEGELSKVRAGTICEKALAEFARNIKLGDYLFLGRGEELTNGRKRPSILADAFEALLASIYLDGSIDDVKRFLLPFVKREIKSILESGHTADYKSILQQIVQQEKGELLEYVLVEESGPAHKRIFTVEARLNNNVVGVGTAGNKREAEQIAAREALSLFGDDA